MRLLSSILAVVAASGIWLYIPSATQAARAEYPVWPSFLSTGCTALQGPSGSTTVVCGEGAFLLTQVNSGYECNQLDINVTSFNSGPFTATGTVNSGSQSNTISINDTGNYYMQFPGFLVNNLITIQISAPDSGSMTIGYVATNPCPVATKTDTPNPSFTATNTPVPVTGTPTPIPTYTPLPSGHSTFTATNTPTAGPTFTATPTPSLTEINCGDVTYPLLNCNLLGSTPRSVPPDHWALGPNTGTVLPTCFGPDYMSNPPTFDGGYSGGSPVCTQAVTAGASGNVYMQYQWQRTFDTGGTGQWSAQVAPDAALRIDSNTCTPGSGTWCTIDLGSVGNTESTQFAIIEQVAGEHTITLIINNIFVSTSSNTPTPAPATSTATLSPATATEAARLTATAAAASFTPTPIPIPGAMSTPIATSTECPGGCAVAALTAVPGLSTITTVDTSPFSQLQHLSLARNGCTAFGYVQVPYPVIHGTPALGSTTPLSVTWTLPVTHDWDNTQPFSNTAIEPCAMSEIPTFVWDFTYWLSVFACSVVFIMWLIGVIGRLSGDENING